jgi:hypothetical protein
VFIHAMRNSHLVKTWLTLSEDDRKQIAKTVRSPVFNTREEVTALLDYIIKNTENTAVSPTGSNTDPLAKEMAWQQLFGGKFLKKASFDDGKMRHLMSFLLDIIRSWLALENIKNNHNHIDLHLCRTLKKKGHHQLFEKEMARAKSVLEKTSLRNDTYYLQKFTLELEDWETVRQLQRDGSDNLQAMNTSFGAFVAINTLRQGCSSQAQKSVAELRMDIPYLSETIRLVEAGNFEGLPGVEAWYNSYKALTASDNELYFNRLKQHLVQDARCFSDSDLRDLYILAINVCIKRINIADKKYIQEAFELYKSGLERRLFLENGFLSKFTYRNVLNLAVAIGEWDWSLAYLHEFSQYLPPKDRENTFTYNLATWCFRKKDYEQAQELLRRVDLKDMLENFDSRRMLLRIYFEKGEWQALTSLLDSFEIYLRRNKSGGYHREMYMNMVRFLKKMAALTPGNTTPREKLRKEITQTKYLAEREWLLSVLG